MFIATFLQKLKSDKKSKGDILTSEIKYCEKEIGENGEEIHRVYASIEIKNKRSKKESDLIFVLVKDKKDDIRDKPFKILYIKEEVCNSSVIKNDNFLCVEYITNAELLIDSKSYQHALDVLESLNSCGAKENIQIAGLIKRCKSGLENKPIHNSSREEVIDERLIDQKNLKIADKFFALREYKKAKEKYFLVKNTDVNRKIYACDNCIKAKGNISKGEELLKSRNKVGAYNYFLKAEKQCLNIGISKKLNQVKGSITNSYLQDAEYLISDRKYLDALDIIRQVYSFDESNQSATRLEKKCMQYNNPKFIRKEIRKAKELFSNEKATRRENAEAFKILYSLRDSKYMDGEAYAYLGAMEYQPKQYGLHKELKISKRELKAYWFIHIEKGINICKSQNNCNPDVNHFLADMEEVLKLNSYFNRH